jgi:hypothetical protein
MSLLLSNAQVAIPQVATAGTCAAATGTVTCDLGDLAVGSQVAVTITVTAPPARVLINNTARVSFTGVDPNPANNTPSVAVRVK